LLRQVPAGGILDLTGAHVNKVEAIMTYDYEGKTYSKDPALGVVGGKLGPRDEVDGEWWYHGHPCQAYLDDTNAKGVECSALPDFGGRCACCNIELAQNGIVPDDMM
jgi:hypothetical protein